MAYKVLYREWRPQNFAQITGQEHITITLQNAISSQKIAHAYLFCGPRGTGKTSTAKVLAKALNCLDRQGSEPCGQCSNCQEIAAGSSMDVIEIDAASNRGIDEVREIRESVKFLPASGSKRVYIIDEVHMLTDPAFNALLKTLEEPPEHLVFILATTEAQKLPLTILSRCQRFDFRRISDPVMAEQLSKIAQAEQITLEPEALELMLQVADGGLRDALGLLDQMAILGQNQVTAILVRQVLGLTSQEILERFRQALEEGQEGNCLLLVEEVYQQGQDLQKLILSLTAYLRRQMVDLWENPQTAAQTKKAWLEALHLLSQTEPEMRYNAQPRILLEIALVKACRLLTLEPSQLPENQLDLALKIQDLEKELRNSRQEKAQMPTPINQPSPEILEEEIPDFNWEELAISPTVPPIKKESQPEPPIPAEVKIEKKSEPQDSAPVSPAPPTQPEDPADQAQLQKITAVWPKVLGSLQGSKKYQNVASFLSNAWPWQAGEQILTLALCQKEDGAEVKKSMLESESNREALSQAIEQICGWKPEIRFALTEQNPPAQPKSKTPPKKEALFQGQEETLDDLDLPF